MVVEVSSLLADINTVLLVFNISFMSKFMLQIQVLESFLMIFLFMKFAQLVIITHRLHYLSHRFLPSLLLLLLLLDYLRVQVQIAFFGEVAVEHAPLKHFLLLLHYLKLALGAIHLCELGSIVLFLAIFSVRLLVRILDLVLEHGAVEVLIVFVVLLYFVFVFYLRKVELTHV